MPITFTSAPSKKFPSKNLTKSCVKKTLEKFGKISGEINYIFVSDEELLEMNKKYLNHDYYTDIITFDNSENAGLLDGDIFISTDRIEENSKIYGNGILEEYLRILGHGVLHLCGLKDKSPKDIIKMREAEDQFIALYFELKNL
jgi:probable rRNA maturation factor